MQTRPPASTNSPPRLNLLTKVGLLLLFLPLAAAYALSFFPDEAFSQQTITTLGALAMALPVFGILLLLAGVASSAVKLIIQKVRKS